MIDIVDAVLLVAVVLLCGPSLFEVFCRLVHVLALFADVTDRRLASLGVTKYLEDCAFIESCENENVRNRIIDILELEQEIISAKSQ